jgi:hypothetical protein
MNSRRGIDGRGIHQAEAWRQGSNLLLRYVRSFSEVSVPCATGRRLILQLMSSNEIHLVQLR